MQQNNKKAMQNSSALNGGGQQREMQRGSKRQREGGGECRSWFQHHKCGQRHTGGQLPLLQAAGEAVSLAEDSRQPGEQPQPPHYFVNEYRNKYMNISAKSIIN